ncbi:MAG: GAF domain-containing sensor histidine kinase [Candidatus Margulisiibacteriota bacterium]
MKNTKKNQHSTNNSPQSKSTDQANYMLEGDAGQLEQVKVRIQHIMDTSLLLNSSLQTERVLAFSLDVVMEVMQAEASSLLLTDKDTGELVFEVARGGKGVGPKLKEHKVRLKPGEGIAGQVAQSGEPLLVENVAQDKNWAGRVDASFGFKTTSIMCVPLKVKGDVIGVLEVLNKKEGGYFNNTDLEYLTLLANQIAVAIDNARVYGELEKANEELENWNETLQLKVNERTKELQKTNEELKKLDKMKGEFLNVVAHDIRSPLTAIFGFADLILESKDNLTEMQLQGVTIIFKEVKRLNRLIDDLLSFARMESGCLQFNMSSVDMKEIFNHASDVFSGEAKIKEVNLVKNIPDEKYIVHGDNNKLAQVAANFISNAMKFTPRNGTVTISAKKINKSGKTFFKFIIEDTGAGIPKEDLGLIFEKFKQSSSKETKKTKGTGLGLYICKEFITNHGGEVGVESDYGHGAKFFFTLPSYEDSK